MVRMKLRPFGLEKHGNSCVFIDQPMSLDDCNFYVWIVALS